MAQASDVSIANQGFPAFRSDLNTVLEAINTVNSGSSEPSTTYANQLWIDTGTSDKLILKMRNSDNDAWITILQVDLLTDTLEEVSGLVIGTDVQAFDADTVKKDVNNTFTAAQRGSTDTDATNTGSVTLDFDTNQNFVLTLTGNVTLANPTTEAVGQSGFIVFIQDGTGGRTVSLGTDYETAGGAGLTLSSAASATDVVPYIVAASGRILLGTPQLAFS